MAYPPPTQRSERNGTGSERKATPQNILIVLKYLNAPITSCFKRVIQWLIQKNGMTVFVEHEIISDGKLISEDDFSSNCFPKLQSYSKEVDVDLIICIGGDGSLIYANSLFQAISPPIITFHLESPGFLTRYNINTIERSLSDVLAANVDICLRTRLKCEIRGLNADGEDEVEFEYLVLNEVIFDRAQSSQVTHMDIYCNDTYMTTLVGDGLIISTPTGSTAYSMAAGASLVHPSVPGIVLTPVCPHSLSFRPIVLPADVELKIMIGHGSLNRRPICAFDGRNQKELDESRYLRVTTSEYSIPCISREDHLNDWFDSLAECLHWNKRETLRISNELKKSKSFELENGDAIQPSKFNGT